MVRCSYASIVAVLVSSGNKIAAGFRAAATPTLHADSFPLCAASSYAQRRRLRALQPTAYSVRTVDGGNDVF
jgi:hypothetical protein